MSSAVVDTSVDRPEPPAPVRTRAAVRRSVSTANVLLLLGPACWLSE